MIVFTVTFLMHTFAAVKKHAIMFGEIRMENTFLSSYGLKR